MKFEEKQIPRKKVDEQARLRGEIVKQNMAISIIAYTTTAAIGENVPENYDETRDMLWKILVHVSKLSSDETISKALQRNYSTTAIPGCMLEQHMLHMAMSAVRNMFCDIIYTANIGFAAKSYEDAAAAVRKIIEIVEDYI